MGAIVSLLIARTSGGLFEYVEPTFRTPVLLSLIAEVAAVLALGALSPRPPERESARPNDEGRPRRRPSFSG